MCQSQKDKFCIIPLYEVVSKVVKPGDSLPVQWLGLHTLIAEGLGSIPGGELKSHQVHELHTVVKIFLILSAFYLKERYTHLNAEFQRIARRDKKAFLSNQCKETEVNNIMGKTRSIKVLSLKKKKKKDLNPLKQKVEWWLPRTEGSWKMGISVDKFIQCAK